MWVVVFLAVLFLVFFGGVVVWPLVVLGVVDGWAGEKDAQGRRLIFELSV